MLVFNLHHVETEISHPSRKHISITPDGLRRLIRTLRALGIEIVSLREVIQHSGRLQAERLQASKNQAILTFDDGYVNNAQFAASVLEEEQCPATIFVLPGRFGGTNAWDQGDLPEEKRDRLMTLAQMQQLAQSPYITFGSHGMRHVHFPEINDADLRHEIHESYRILSSELGEAFVPVLAYPWGDTSTYVIERMAQSPYQFAFTVQNGQWRSDTPRFAVPRYSIFWRDANPFVLLAKLGRHGLLFR